MANDNKVKIRVLEIEGDPDEDEDGDVDEESEQPRPVAQQTVKRGWCSECGTGVASHEHREHMRRTGQLCGTCNRAKSSMEHQERCAAGPKGNGAAVPKSDGSSPGE